MTNYAFCIGKCNSIFVLWHLILLCLYHCALICPLLAPVRPHLPFDFFDVVVSELGLISTMIGGGELYIR